MKQTAGTVAISSLVSTAALLSFCLIAAADRMPVSLGKAIDTSDVVVMGKVASILESNDVPHLSFAKVQFMPETLKGELVAQEGTIEFRAASRESAGCPCPLQLEEGKSYCFFLVSEGNSLRLINEYDGAVELEKRSRYSLEQIQDELRESLKRAELFKFLELKLTSTKAVFLEGEPIPLIFELENKGTDMITVNAQVLDQNGRLSLRGNTQLGYQEIRNGKTAKSADLGGVNFRDSDVTSEIVLPAGTNLAMSATFEWASFGKDRGQYELVWRIGSIESRPLTYEIIRKPQSLR